MVTIDPHDGYDVDGQVDKFRDAILSGLDSALERTAKLLDPHEPVQSSGRFRTFWKSRVDGLVDHLKTVVDTAASHTRGQLQAVVDGALTAAIEDPFMIPPPADLLAEIYLKSRQKFIVDIGNDTWGDIRRSLVEGMQDGEGIPELRDRITGITEFEHARAERIARTEVIGAVNAGSIGQVRAANMQTEKTWLATNDLRTRPSHAAVNGVTIDLAQSFNVSGWPMDRPHDPSAPAEEIIECRCTLTFEITDIGVIAAAFGKPDQQRDYHGRWGKGGAKGPSTSDTDITEAKRTSLSEWQADAKDIAKKSKRSTTGDQQLLEIWRKQGFTGKPTSVSKEEFDADRSGGVVTYRGLRGPDHAKYGEQFLSGDEPFAGYGTYGNGTYVTSKRDIAKDYAAGGSYIRMRFKPGAKIVERDKLNDKMIGEMDEVNRLGKEGKFNDMLLHTKLVSQFGDPGHAASAYGYDAIHATEGTRDYYVVLNRTAVTVDSTIYGGDE